MINIVTRVIYTSRHASNIESNLSTDLIYANCQSLFRYCPLLRNHRGRRGAGRASRLAFERSKIHNRTAKPVPSHSRDPVSRGKDQDSVATFSIFFPSSPATPLLPQWRDARRRVCALSRSRIDNARLCTPTRAADFSRPEVVPR